MKYKMLVIGLVATMISIMGCTTTRTYTGEQRPVETISILKGAWNEYFIESVSGHVATVDGKDVRASDKVEVLPGKHEVSVFLVNRSTGLTFTGKPVNFSIITEAGHVYIVDGNWNSYDNQIWIEDENTRKIIAGEKPK